MNARGTLELCSEERLRAALDDSFGWHDVARASPWEDRVPSCVEELGILWREGAGRGAGTESP